MSVQKIKLDPDTIHKIILRYAVFINGVTRPFATLNNHRITEVEQDRLLHFFICATVFDDFFESNAYSHEELEKMSFHPEKFYPKNEYEILFIASNKILTRYAIHKPGYLETKRKVFDAEVESLKQRDSTITKDTLKEITYRKGGYSVLHSRYYLDLASDETQDRCWYQLGALIQLGNDLFDIHKDLQDGILTFPNQIRSTLELSQELTTQVLIYLKWVESLDANKKVKSKFKFITSVISALSYVGLDQLRSIELKHELLPNLNALSRKDLIVDMEKWNNRWRLLKHLYAVR